MKKMIKLSLVAAVAVAGFGTAASASDVKLGGSLAQQVQKRDTADALTVNTKIILKASGSVNDNISFVVSTIERSSETDQLGNGAKGLQMGDAKFIAKIGGATVTFGRQGLTTPWTNGASTIDAVETGNGVIAVAPVGGVTVVGAYIADHTIDGVPGVSDGSNDIAIAAVMAKAGIANVQAWYMNVAESDLDASYEGLSALTLAADAKVAGATVKAKYSTLTTEADDNTNSLLSIEANAKVGAMTVNAGYAQSGTDGDLVSLDTGGNAGNAAYMGAWNLGLGEGGHADTTLVSVGAKMPLVSNLTGNLNIASMTGDNVNDSTEIKAQVSASIAKNFSLYLRHAIVSQDVGDGFTRTRLFAAYKF